MFGNNYGYGYNNWQPGNFVPQSPVSSNPPYRYQASMTSPQLQYDSNQKPALQVPWVNGEVGAQAYIIAPNSTVLLMDSDNPIFYIKTSDASGKAVIQAFKYQEVKSESPVSSSDNYVTKKEFEEFKSSILNRVQEEKI